MRGGYIQTTTGSVTTGTRPSRENQSWAQALELEEPAGEDRETDGSPRSGCILPLYWVILTAGGLKIGGNNRTGQWSLVSHYYQLQEMCGQRSRLQFMSLITPPHTHTHPSWRLIEPHTPGLIEVKPFPFSWFPIMFYSTIISSAKEDCREHTSFNFPFEQDWRLYKNIFPRFMC